MTKTKHSKMGKRLIAAMKEVVDHVEGTIGRTGGKSPAGFSERKSIAELAAEQGVRLEGQLERIMGAGAGLWASDKEFEGFVQGIYDRRREGLSLGKP